MSIPSQDLVHVYYHGTGTAMPMGRLLFKNRQIFFEYNSAFIKSGLALSPFKLPLKAGVIPSTDRTFDGLFGLFNDSLPDGWGRLLIDRKLMSLGLNPSTLSPLDRLCFVGTGGMGALSYEPENPNTISHLTHDLDEIDSEIQATFEENDAYVDELLVLGGSSAGARPKVLLKIDGEDWLIKFRSHFDSKDIGAIEYAYHLMARDAGLLLPDAEQFPSRQGMGFFGVKRFDLKNDHRVHMHTVAGLLHADHREPALDYESIMKATLYLTKDIRQCEMQFRHAVFNVLSHNRDDHSKNFSFLMDSMGHWRVSPAYDLTFSSGPAGEHATMVMGEGRNPTQKHLLSLASIGNIKEDKALEIIHQVVSAVDHWDDYAAQVNVSSLQRKNIREALCRVRRTIIG